VQALQLHGLQRQPPDLQVQAGLAFVASVIVILLVFGLRLPCGDPPSTFRTTVRSQA
jgi:multisubunit Na+/H+ antiporter MnhB subunit